MKKHFNKSRCRKCIYHSSPSGGSTICSYATRNKEEHTCLYRGSDGKTHDRRGDDPNNCLLFKAGKPPKERKVY